MADALLNPALNLPSSSNRMNHLTNFVDRDHLQNINLSGHFAQTIETFNATAYDVSTNCS